MTQMADILVKILERKKEENAERSQIRPVSKMEEVIQQAGEPRGFYRALNAKLEQGLPAVIAEIKKASPSKGVIREDFDPDVIARSYEKYGAACLSVLTDEDFFQGHERFLKTARQASSLPVIRKDFIIDSYQVYEARAMGADCILLIAAALDDQTLDQLNELAVELGMDVLLEVHDQDEMDRALDTSIPLIGINNRNLRNFEVSLDTTLKLMEQVPDDRILITESGIHTQADVNKMRDAEIHAFLVGEAFMRQSEPGIALKQLFDLL